MPHGREKGTERPLICHHHLQRNVTPLELRGVPWGQPLLQELHGDGLLETRDRWEVCFKSALRTQQTCDFQPSHLGSLGLSPIVCKMRGLQEVLSDSHNLESSLLEQPSVQTHSCWRLGWSQPLSPQRAHPDHQGGC